MAPTSWAVSFYLTQSLSASGAADAGALAARTAALLSEAAFAAA